jgi:L-lysine 6-transaminase
MAVLNLKSEMTAADVLETLRSRIIVDGFGFVADPQFSHDAYLHDAAGGRDFLDFYAFFASQPISYNHPRMREPEFQARLLTAATTKVANSDCYTRFYAEFVKTLDEIAAPSGFVHFFFIDGGALAVENALKAAFDWKVRKNLAAGRGELGTQVIHLRKAFHGRSGYTMSLTNTDPTKTQYFPKFTWPRVDNPCIDFTLPEPQRAKDAAERERQAIAQIEAAVAANPHDIAALILEPIQGEGGDNHFRREFFVRLRELADKHDFILIFDEIQSGVGITGKMWAHQHFGVAPDIIVFGKKMQVCGIMSNARVDEVDSVFKVSSRINSTWGGNLVDMVRATQYLRIIEDENLVEQAGENGVYLLEGLQRLASQHPIVTAPRGRGLMCAFDLPDPQTRNALRRACYERQMLVLNSGERSIRFRPMLDVDPADIDRGIEILDDALQSLEQASG